MEVKQSIQQEIYAIKDNSTKLYSYLYNLVYEEKIKDIKLLESIYDSFLSDDRTEIKRIAIYALLFGLKIRNEKYKEIALKYAEDVNSTFDLRLTCMSALGEAYMDTKDNILLSLFFNVYQDENEDEDLRAQSFIRLMKVLGMSSIDILRKNANNLIISFDDIVEDEFQKELNEIAESLTSPK